MKETYTIKAVYTWPNWMEDAAEGEMDSDKTGVELFIEAEELVKEWGFRPMRDGNILPNGEGGHYVLQYNEKEEYDEEEDKLIKVTENIIIITVWPEEGE